MAVQIYDPQALDLITAIEGQSWRAHQESGRFGDNSFHVFKRAWEALTEEERHQSDPQRNFIIVLPSGACSIFGAGSNRYTVRRTGEILFLRLKSFSQKTTDLASSLGFTVYL